MEAKEITYDEMREAEIRNIQKESGSSQPLLALSIFRVSNNYWCEFFWNAQQFNTLYIGLKTFPATDSSCQVRVDIQYSDKPTTHTSYTVANGKYEKIQYTPDIKSISVFFIKGTGLTTVSNLSIGVI